jgi:predicted nucleic acid-binding Zn ribbon protein
MAGRYRYDCDHCDARFLVDGAMRASLLDDGCPACGTEVRERMFSRVAAEATEE